MRSLMVAAALLIASPAVAQSVNEAQGRYFRCVHDRITLFQDICEAPDAVALAAAAGCGEELNAYGAATRDEAGMTVPDSINLMDKLKAAAKEQALVTFIERRLTSPCD